MEKKTEKEVRQEVDQRLREIALLKEEIQHQGLVFSCLNESQLTRKVKGESSKSPYIYAQGWTSGTTPGSAAVYTVYIANPDPASYYPMFVSIFFGVANFLDDIGAGLSGRDTRWPYLSTAPFSLAAGATTSKTFNYITPAGIALSTYMGNSVVWRGDWHDKGAYLDRGLFSVTLS